MSKKQKLILLTITLSLILLSVGLSFAFFTSISNNESASTLYAKGGTMNIKYANGSGNIAMGNIYPREKEWATKTFTVTGNNTTKLEMNYRLYLFISKNTFNFGDLTYSISGTTTNSADTLISKDNQPMPSGGQILMGAGIFKSKTSTHSYNLRIFYKETGDNQNNGQDKSFAGYVKIDSGSVHDYDALTNVSSDSKSPAFNGPIAREEVEEITFNNTNIVPSNALASWDASEKQNGSIMAYTLDEDNDDLYELYVGQIGGVVANPNSSSLFARFSKLKTLNLNNLDTTKVTNMSGMFAYNTATEIKGLDKFNTSNVTSMWQMFFYSKATTLNLSSFDTSKVTSMSSMFDQCEATSLDLNSFDTSKVTSMYSMFAWSDATEIKGLDKFNTSNVTNMGNMFFRSAATEIKGLNKFNTSKVTNMRYMFFNSKATTLNLSSFDTSKVTDMSYMFQDSKVTSLDLSSFDTSNVTDMNKMFYRSSATIGYARTQEDADKFNSSSDKPSGLNFIVKSS